MDAGALFDKIAVDLEDGGVSVAEQSGTPSLRAADQAFAALAGESMVFRLPADTPSRSSALGLLGAEAVDQTGQPTPDGDWVRVPVSECNEWERLADAARDAVG